MIKMYTKLLKEESGLKALESRALRNMSGPKSSGTVQHINLEGEVSLLNYAQHLPFTVLILMVGLSIL
jgi:hypothetical protein